MVSLLNIMPPTLTQITNYPTKAAASQTRSLFWLSHFDIDSSILRIILPGKW